VTIPNLSHLVPVSSSAIARNHNTLKHSKINWTNGLDLTPSWSVQIVVSYYPALSNRGFNSKKREKGKTKWIHQPNAKWGAIALIVAGIGAFLVPSFFTACATGL